MTWSALVLMVVVGAQAPLDEGLALFNSGNFEAALTQVEALLRLEKGSAERARFEPGATWRCEGRSMVTTRSRAP